ncbi:hypothetical protein OIO90_002864 [Microbotryomycetes sp. JL221]|nr:hypothetical protein OIO90_002864 [Microbotryomycetes sp. JL221]
MAPWRDDMPRLSTRSTANQQSRIAWMYRTRRRVALLVASSVLALWLVAWPSLGSSSRRTPFEHNLGPPAGNTTWSAVGDQQVPPFVHYVFGLSPDFGGKPFSFIHFVCVMSALRKLKPETIYVHHVYEPTGFYWDEIQREIANSGTTKLELVKQRDVTHIFGNKVEHYAHKADVLRLEALRDYGGIYLDIDVLVVKDLGPLYRHATVMGMESQPNTDPQLPPSGLCNAVILSRPYSPFISRWMETYRTFSKEKWAKHSVTTPWDLARAYPSEITVLNKFAFFWPIWHDDHLRLIHRSASYPFHSKPSPLAPTSDSQFTYHLWESVAFDRYLSPYDPDRIHNRGFKTGSEREEDGASDENSFSKETRQYVSLKMRHRWRAAKAKGLL